MHVASHGRETDRRAGSRAHEGNSHLRTWFYAFPFQLLCVCVRAPAHACSPLPPHGPQDELARSVTLEQGKTLADARGDVFRGLGGFVGGITGGARRARTGVADHKEGEIGVIMNLPGILPR